MLYFRQAERRLRNLSFVDSQSVPTKKMKKNVITDKLYGKIIIEEPVIVTLIQNPSMQRLKGIDQAGFFQPHFRHTKHTRFEHSVGVYYLLRKFGAPLEEQIAGLIHDISHSAFSHCIDYALAGAKEGEQAHQDGIFKEFVMHTDIPKIVKQYGYVMKDILDDRRHPLKETTMPDLCADRLDYSLRSALVYNHTPIKKLHYLLSHLTVKNHAWVFTNYESAKVYAELFYILNITYYAGLPSAIMFRTVGDVVSYALKQGYLRKDDLYVTDVHALSILKKNAKNDQKLALLYGRMTNPEGIQNNPSSYDSTVICKSRIIDPYFLDTGKIKRLSEKYPKWKEVIAKELQPKKYYLKFPK